MNRATWGTLVLLLAAIPSHAQSAFRLDGLVTGRAAGVDSRPSWIEGGFGRLGAGADAAGDEELEAFGALELGLTWEPSPHFALFVSGLARVEPSSHRGRAAGLQEAYLEGRLFPRVDDPIRTSGRLRLRAGLFFLPTSRENVDLFWTSPYTLTLSALNSWIGEEVRPIGLDLDYRLRFPSDQRLSAGGTLFGGNDSMGALLSWRGWAMHDRLTVFEEVLPLPPLDSLETVFRSQRDDGTRPFGRDLDGREGWSARIRWEAPDRALVQYTHLDNRGDRHLYEGEYAWETDFDLIALELRPTPSITLIAEVMRGSSGMGPLLPATPAQFDFNAAYLLVSWQRGTLRWSMRYDEFETRERDHHPLSENNDEDGRAITIATFWTLRPSIQLALELIDLDSERPAALRSGFSPDTDGRSVSVAVRGWFGR